MGTLLNSIAIICLSIAFYIHTKNHKKFEKFEISKDDIERAERIQNMMEGINEKTEEFIKKSEKLLK